MRRRWKLPDPGKARQISELAQALDAPGAFAAVLVNRGVTTADTAASFLKPDRSQLYDPLLLPDIEPALDRLRTAIDKGERIFICGDYDVDGITSIVLMKRCLESAGVDVGFYIPNRLDEGYGLSERGVVIAKESGAGLIVTVDSGVTGHEQIDVASKLGIDVIVTDHHEPQDTLPNALAVVDPKRKDSRYPYKDLAGVGVAFKVLEALARDYRDVAYTVEENLDIVAVGTVADIVPLNSENRILTSLGLDRLRATTNPGLAALMKAAAVEPASVQSTHIGFALGPRLNAAGRLGDASIGVELLTTEDASKADAIALELDGENRKRRQLERQVLDDATRILEETVDLGRNRSIVLWSAGWHAGVIGIVASRIAKQYNRPTVLLSITDGIAKGSGRSIPGFDLHAALISCKDHLLSFGGHQYAAGVSLAEEHLEVFRACVEDAVSSKLSPDDLVSEVEIDAMIPLTECSFELVNMLKRVRPFGAGNPEPVFGTRDVKVTSAKVVGNGHLKMTVEQGEKVMDAIGFGLGEVFDDLKRSGGMVSLAYVLEENTWRGVTNLQLRLKDVQFEEY
ncbi:single-stranded-DNA-specific exonuclease RecJ [bacterium]|nr:single-stranded-DNA-specific exonuclease RecJ [bacterium]